MTAPKPPNGRKYTLTKVGLGMIAAAQIGVFVLAAIGKMTGDVASVTTVFLGAVAGLIGLFHGANAYITGKTGGEK